MTTLREARLQALLSMRQLARKAGISPTTIYLLESGQRSPQLLTIYKLSRALGIAPEEIEEFRRVLDVQPAVEQSHEEAKFVTKPEKSATSITTALVYTRVSSEEQAREGVSLDAQLTECRRYAAQHGWMLGSEFQDVLSGKRDDRPAYQALLTEVRRLRAEGQSVVVVVFRLDRLGRRILERVRCREELKALGVPVHSVREGGEVSDLVANILASVAEEESRALGERVAASIQHIRANGWYSPSRAPWGYRLRSATVEERSQGAPASVLEPDPETMTWVQEAFSRAAAGETLRAVHRWATALPSHARGDRDLTYQAVRRILASPVYIGRLPTAVTMCSHVLMVAGSPLLTMPRGCWSGNASKATSTFLARPVSSIC